jgi:hypothetical protein
MKTNDIKKGMKFRLRNGWHAVMEDNMKGNTRMAKVFGYETEIGSIYAHDVMAVLVEGDWVAVEHTPAQNALRTKLSAMGF